MRRLILAALAVVACAAALPSNADAQDVRAQRRAEIRQRAQERRAEIRQQILQRRPLLRQRLEQRRLQGRPIRPLVRRPLVLRRMEMRRPELFDRLDLNKDGVLSREEFLQRIRRRVGRT